MASIRALRSVFPSLAGTTTASVLFPSQYVCMVCMVMGLTAPDITVFFFLRLWHMAMASAAADAPS